MKQSYWHLNKESLFSVIVSERKSILVYFILFMIIHGEMAFNKLSWHDDIVCTRGWSDDGSHGRFTQRVLADFLAKVSGIESLPVINCLIMAGCSVIIGLVVQEMLHINNKISRIAIMLICISIPVLSGHMGYMSSAGFDMFGALLAAIAAYYTINYQGLASAIIAIILFALSIGEYQCHISLFLSIILCGFLKRVLEQDISVKKIYVTFLRYGTITVGGLALYLVLLQISFILYEVQLTSYAGTNTYGITSFSGYWRRVVFAYRDFVNPTDARYSMFPFHWGGGILFYFLSLVWA